MIESEDDADRLDELVTLISILPKSERYYHLCIGREAFREIEMEPE